MAASKGEPDPLVQNYAHILELKQRRKVDEQQLRLKLDNKKMDLDSWFRTDRERYLALEGHPELLNGIVKLLKEVNQFKARDLDREYDEELAALRKRYEEMEASQWQNVLNIDVPPPSTSGPPPVSFRWTCPELCIDLLIGYPAACFRKAAAAHLVILYRPA